MADTTGASVHRVRTVIRRAGITRPPGLPATSDEDAAAIVRAVTDGAMTQAQAARKFRRDHGTVQRVLRRSGAVLVPDADYIRAAAAAAIIGVSARHVSVLARQGKIGYKRVTPRGTRLYSKADAEALGALRAGSRP